MERQRGPRPKSDKRTVVELTEGNLTFSMKTTDVFYQLQHLIGLK